MKNIICKSVLALTLLALMGVATPSTGQDLSFKSNIDQAIQQPSDAAKPWAIWYWMHGAFSKKGITADLQAMKEAGMGGAYLMPVLEPTDPPLYKPVTETLTPRWWDLVEYAMNEADRLGLELGFHVSDGFATAGGPWTTPAQSMQKVVWSKTHVQGGRTFSDTLTQPETNEGYYRDIKVVAYPNLPGVTQNSFKQNPTVTTSLEDPEADPQVLVEEGNEEGFGCDDPCWIQLEFDQPFTARSVTMHTGGDNYQSNRLRIQVSDDGEEFRSLGRLQPPRLGWQDWDEPITHALEEVTARYYRFSYDPEGSEPGAEDLDDAKWEPELQLQGIELSGIPRIHNFEGKNGSMWMISERTTEQQVPQSHAVSMDSIIDITEHLQDDGTINWDVPEGNWTILRMGHTSTGHTNSTGGAGEGLEVDKFREETVKMQYENWYGEAIETAGPELANRVLKLFHMDSWEAGSQNWSPVFRKEFMERRGYDPLPYLPAMAGVPVESAGVSERFLHDVRQTIAELINDVFFGTLSDLAHSDGKLFSAENVSPTMVSDGMLHFKNVDLPMGEFWLRSPTHDKPNDMRDAISAGHIYGKPTIVAEAFTEIRMEFDEHPAMLKAMGDRNYALGINRFAYHVFAHNPWTDREPGMTLHGIGLFFQPSQTWWEPGKAWVDYAHRSQAVLQQGKPVADIAVFTGEETPRRSVLPDRLVPTLPGIFGEQVVQQEKIRLANEGQPQQEIPVGVDNSANMAEPQNWTDPLRGYSYDSINRDALLNLASVKDGKVVLPGGSSYKLLVLPGSRKMNPHADLMTPEVAQKFLELVRDGATLLVEERPEKSPSLENYPKNDQQVQDIINELWSNAPENPEPMTTWSVGRGQVIKGPYTESTFDKLSISRDVQFTDDAGHYLYDFAWNHRQSENFDIYFISNQRGESRSFNLSLRAEGRVPELYNTVTGKIKSAEEWKFEDGRTKLPLKLAPNGSVFVILRKQAQQKSSSGQNWLTLRSMKEVEGEWEISFNPQKGGPQDTVTFRNLTDWVNRQDSTIKYYSGTATYTNSFGWHPADGGDQRVWLDLGKVANIASVTVNGIDCGVAWTEPFRVEITDAIKEGQNELEIAVTNTWRNRLIRDRDLPEEQRVGYLTDPVPDYWVEEPLVESGLLGPVKIKVE